MAEGLVCLASYPRSGSTWVRAVLTALERGEPDLDRLVGVSAASRALLEAGMGVSCEDLTDREVEALRPSVYRRLAADGGLLKVHDGFRAGPQGVPLMPPEAVRSVIYLARSPLDVAVSLAHHMGRPLEWAVAALDDPFFTFTSRRGHPQVRQDLGTWSGHVEGWLDSGLPLRVFRYEDLLERPGEAFAEIALLAGLEVSGEAVARAVEACRFERLRRREEEQGFAERPARSDAPFFRRGRAGAWREALTGEQADRIRAAHGRVMERLGYL